MHARWGGLIVTPKDLCVSKRDRIWLMGIKVELRWVIPYFNGKKRFWLHD